MMIPGAQAQLRLPGNLSDILRQALLALEQGLADPGSQAETQRRAIKEELAAPRN
jgi:Arc/MetJ-type ribon-helix-helix transcriptional regulator